MKVIFFLALLLTLSLGKCPDNICDCKWSTPSFKIPVVNVNVGSKSISVCDILPNAVTNSYNSEIAKFKDDVLNGPAKLQQKIEEKLSFSLELDDIKNTVENLEEKLGMDKVVKFFSSNNNFVNVVDNVVDGLKDVKNALELGMILPVKLVKLFPELINDVSPDELSAEIRERASQVMEWFTKGLMETAVGLTDSKTKSCATCLYDNLNNGAISFEIGVDTSFSVFFSLILRTTQTFECLVNSFAELTRIMHDAIPDEVRDVLDGVGDGLVAAADGLVLASEAIRGSDFCNAKYDIPPVNIKDTGLEPLDKFFSELEKFVNIVGENGPFGKIMRTISGGICSAADSDGFADFSRSLRDFFDVVSFTRLEDVILKGLFNAITKMTQGLHTFRNMDLNINPDTCDQNNRACRLVAKYGSNYLRCIQEEIQDQTLSVSMTFSLGENWAPPSIAGFGVGLFCADLDCIACLAGLKHGGPITESFKFLASEIVGFDRKDNSAQPKNCIEIDDCGSGTWDDEACACRCNDGFIAKKKEGCLGCPRVDGKICNGTGACYMKQDGPACCCLDGITTKDCSL